MLTQPNNDEIENPSKVTRLNGKVTRLNGKTIHEWKEDCENFYREKADEQKKNEGLNSEYIKLENENFDLKEIIRRQKNPIPQRT